MQNFETITIKEYLDRKGVKYQRANGELVTHCLFSGCDEDSSGKEAHLYFDEKTGQYDCKKCGTQGNIHTLREFWGDELKDIALNWKEPSSKKQKYNESDNVNFDNALVESCHANIPDDIRRYLNDRGISDIVIKQYKLGFGNFYGKTWITIPIKDQSGDYAYFKLRRNPKEGKEKVTYPSGEAQLYDWETVPFSTEKIIICEGELDRLALVGRGISAVTSTHGAGTFKDDWVKNLLNVKSIYVCFDNDKAGREGAERLIYKFKEAGHKSLYKVILPKEVGTGGDITDFLIKLDGNIEDLTSKYAKEILNLEELPRIKKIDKIDREVAFPDWKSVVIKNFPELKFPAEVGLSIMAQILITDVTNPFALVFVDVPSSGKTIAINFFSEIEGLTYATDKFTPASFVSNSANVSKEELKDIDLLPRLKYKMFMIRDLATLFSKRDDDLNESLGILTRVLDGEGLNTDSGVHGQRQYVGEYLFMLLAASTPIPPRVWKMMGNLGSRLFFLKMLSKEKSETELAEQLIDQSYKQKEKQCREITKDFLQTLWFKNPEGVIWEKSKDDRETVVMISRCAQLLAKLRGVINVWKDKSVDGNEYEYTQPVIEKPDRINQLFYNLARGHALVCGRRQINNFDLKLVIEISIDSAPTTRAKLFRALLDIKGIMATKEVMEALNCSRPTALKEMEALKILKVCNLSANGLGSVGEPEKFISLTDEFSWIMSEKCKNIRELSS